MAAASAILQCPYLVALCAPDEAIDRLEVIGVAHRPVERAINRLDEVELQKIATPRTRAARSDPADPAIPQTGVEPSEYPDSEGNDHATH